jgi:LytS/YehU family sensor histidine kinase
VVFSVYRWDRRQVVAVWLNYTRVLLVWHALFFALREAERAVELRAIATEMRLQVLEVQLREHFLFNTINTAIALIPHEPERAVNVFHRLADRPPGALRQRGTLVSVSEEVELVNAYIDIERVRFANAVDVTIDVARAVHRALMPNGILLSS